MTRRLSTGQGYDGGMRRLLCLPALIAALALPASAQPGRTELTLGEIQKVDRAARKLTIKHGEIRNVEMPPMTMVFQVGDVAMLEKLKAGDKIRFAVEKAATGEFVVTTIQPAR
jgi:Cu(I)/Ag(I) efflux system periplasmic protein CusF